MINETRVPATLSFAFLLPVENQAAFAFHNASIFLSATVALLERYNTAN